MSDEYKCDACGRDLSAAADCNKCMLDMEAYNAKFTCWGHLWEAAKDLFNFQFSGCIVSLCWMIMRLFKIGDYEKGGNFDRRGLLPKDFFD